MFAISSPDEFLVLSHVKCFKIFSLNLSRIVFCVRSFKDPFCATADFHKNPVEKTCLTVFFGNIFTGSIARSANCRYLIYSEADFEVFRHAGATRCTDGGEIYRQGSPPPRQISPPLVQRLGYRIPKTDFLN